MKHDYSYILVFIGQFLIILFSYALLCESLVTNFVQSQPSVAAVLSLPLILHLTLTSALTFPFSGICSMHSLSLQIFHLMDNGEKNTFVHIS